MVKISIEEFPNRLNRLTDRSTDGTDETDGNLGIYDASANSVCFTSIPLTLSPPTDFASFNPMGFTSFNLPSGERGFNA